jgi:phosphatidate cytidylyltransferase
MPEDDAADTSRPGGQHVVRPDRDRRPTLPRSARPASPFAGDRGSAPPPDDSPPSQPASRRDVGGRDLPTAIAVGVVLAGLFLGSLAWRPLAFTFVVAGLVAVAAVEAGAELRKVDVPTAVPAVLLGSLVTVFGAHRSGHAGQAAGVLVLFVAATAWLLADPDRRDVVRTIAMTVMLGLWLGFLASFAILLVTRPGDGRLAVLAVVGAAIFGDIGGYAVGVRFGRTKIAPSISPNKSVEGLVGGVVVSALLAAIVLPLLGDLFTPWTAVVVAVVSVLAGFVGDLTESMVKRDLGVKDLGSILPGHGGILDRVDGILVALPVGFFAIALVT